MSFWPITMGPVVMARIDHANETHKSIPFQSGKLSRFVRVHDGKQFLCLRRSRWTDLLVEIKDFIGMYTDAVGSTTNFNFLAHEFSIVVIIIFFGCEVGTANISSAATPT